MNDVLAWSVCVRTRVWYKKQPLSLSLHHSPALFELQIGKLNNSE